MARDGIIFDAGKSIFWRPFKGVGPENRDFFGPWNGNDRTVVYIARDGILMRQIHFEGHWKGWALKIEPFWALKWQREKRVPFGPKKVKFFLHRPKYFIWNLVWFSNLTLISKCLSFMRIRIRIVFISCHQCCAAGPGEEAAATAGQLQPFLGQDWASRGADTPRNSSGQRLAVLGICNIFFGSGSADLDPRGQLITNLAEAGSWLDILWPKKKYR